VFYELRQYRLQFSGVGAFMEAFASTGRPILAECGFEILGAWVPESGPDTGTAFTWMVRWPDLNARTQALEAVRSHPDYPKFAALTKSLVKDIDSRLLRPLPFSAMS
jgi:hypothetical protein